MLQKARFWIHTKAREMTVLETSIWAKLHPWERSSWFLGRPAMGAGLYGFGTMASLLKPQIDALPGHPKPTFAASTKMWKMPSASIWLVCSTYSTKKMITWNDHLVLGQATWKKWNHGPHSFGSPYSLWLNTPCPFDGCKLYPSIGSWRRLPMFN